MSARARPLRVGLVQMSMSREKAANAAAAEAGIRDAAAAGAELICLPELYLTPYFCQTEDAACFELAEPVPGPTTSAVAALAAELGVTVIASLFERRAAGVFHNTAAVVDAARGYVGKYRKMHIPDDPRYYEKFYFTPGDLGFRAFDTAAGRLGVLVCWDQWFPEAARLTALNGAEILFYPTAIGWHPAEKAALGATQRDAWETVQRAHAIANGCFVAAVNRHGLEAAPDGGDGIEFWGGSLLVGPDGRVIARAPADADAILVEEIDLAELDAARTGWPFFRDRRIDAYSELTRRFVDNPE